MTENRTEARLRAIAQVVDGPPPVVAAAARAALSTRRLDGELAELTADSAMADLAVRGEREVEVRLLSFETATVSVELQVDAVDERLTMRGLVSGAAGEAVVETATEHRAAPIDPQGWFLAADLPRGLVRVRLAAQDGTSVTTSWVSV